MPAGTPSPHPDPSIPDFDRPLIEVDHLTIHFPVGRSRLLGRQQQVVHAVEDVSFSINRGETLGLAGESGSGKTTTGRAILRRIDPKRGTIRFRGRDITQSSGQALRHLRRHMQLVFQDPYASLNPRMNVLDLVAEPLIVHGIYNSTDDAREYVLELLEQCGLSADTADRFPHAFSGGQRQRIGIARAIGLRPEFIVADEPVSALDVSIRAQVVNLLQDLQDELGITYLFIAHDLSVVRHISNRVAIMYAGQIVEIADRDTIYERPLHPYTEALLSSIPVPNPQLQRDRRRIVLSGEIPDTLEPPSGCRFASRCPLVEERCHVEMPSLSPRSETHDAACWVR